MKTAADIHNAISQVCPIDGISVGSIADKSTWRVDYSPSATTTQKTAAEDVVRTIDVNVDPVVDPLDKWDIIALKVTFNHENRIRVLEGKAAITMTQYKTALKALL